MSTTKLFWYVIAIALLAAVMFGIVVPTMISYDDTLVVWLGIALLTGTAFVLMLAIIKLIKVVTKN